MKNITFLIIAMAASLFTTACSSVHTAGSGIRVGSTTASRIAKDPQIAGKGVPGQCLPFAQALQQKFEAAGIPSRVIVFGYDVSPVPSSGLDQSGHAGDRGAHAAVAYEDGGRTYLMDNQSWSPEWVRDGAPMQMAQQFAGINTQVRMARVMNSETLVTVPTPSDSGVRLAAR